MNRVPSVLSTLALAASAATGACAGGGDPTPDPFAGVDQATLEAAEPSNELIAAAEAPMIDDGLAIRFTADPSLSSDGDVEALMREPRTDRLPPRFGRDALVAIRWGYFPPHAGGEITDWSGFIAVSRGAIELIRPLRFENDGSRPLGPAEDAARHGADPRVVRFTSHTLPAWDGLLLRIHRDEVRPAVLVIKVGATMRVLPFEELFELDAAEIVDDAGHELRIRAHTPPPACAVEVGRAGGAWGAIDEDHGLLRGRLETAGDLYGVRARTLDVRGPYGLFRGGLAEPPAPGEAPPAPGDVDPVARVGGFYAAFHYSSGGALIGRLRSPGDEELRGAILGRWLPAADLPAGVELPPGADAGFRAVMLQRDPSCTPE